MILLTDTGGVVAGPAVRAHVVSERDTVAPHTARHPVTAVSLVTQANRPVLPSQVVGPGLAVGVGTAGVRSAEVGRGEGAAGDEGVSSVSPGAGTDGLVTSGLAVSVEAAGRPASVHVIGALGRQSYQDPPPPPPPQHLPGRYSARGFPGTACQSHSLTVCSTPTPQTSSPAQRGRKKKSLLGLNLLTGRTCNLLS